MPVDAKRIEKNIWKLRKILKRAPKLPSPEDVHELRTRAIRLESTFEAVGLTSKHNERRILRQLAHLRKIAGKVRDMDVLTSHLSEIRLNRDKDCLVQLLEHVGAERYRLARQLHRSIEQRGEEVCKRLKRTAARLERIEEDGQKTSGPQSKIDIKATATVLQLSRALKTPAVLSPANLHSYRMKIKELRYVLQAQKSNTTQQLINELGECKDAIGEWHDWHELVKIATELLRDHPNCGVLHDLSAIQQKKYDSALALAEKLRREYVTPNSKPGHGSADQRNPPQRKLKVAAALAS